MRRWLIALAALLIIALAHPYWLGAMGTFLVEAQGPEKSDAIVVLAGDSDGLRIFKGGELAREGFAPKVLMSGPRPIYGISEAELAINDAVRHGFDRALFEPLEAPSSSTEEEAVALVPLLRQRDVKSVLVVTSDYHTGRAGRIWRRIAKGMRVRMVAAPDTFFHAKDWWKTRGGRKTAFMEWVKTLTGPMGA